MSRHVLGRVTFDFEMASEQQAAPVQDRIGRYASELLPPLLQAHFDGQSWQYDRLVIDLGPVSLTGLEAEISQKLAAELLRLRRFDARQIESGAGPDIGADFKGNDRSGHGAAHMAAGSGLAGFADTGNTAETGNTLHGPAASDGQSNQAASGPRGGRNGPTPALQSGAQTPADPRDQLGVAGLAADLALVLRAERARHHILSNAPLGDLVMQAGLAMPAASTLSWLTAIWSSPRGRAGLVAALTSPQLRALLQHCDVSRHGMSRPEGLPRLEGLRLRAGLERASFDPLWRGAVLAAMARNGFPQTGDAIAAAVMQSLGTGPAQGCAVSGGAAAPASMATSAAQTAQEPARNPVGNTVGNTARNPVGHSPVTGLLAQLAVCRDGAGRQQNAVLSAPADPAMAGGDPALALIARMATDMGGLLRDLRAMADRPDLPLVLLDHIPPQHLARLLRALLGHGLWRDLMTRLEQALSGAETDGAKRGLWLAVLAHALQQPTGIAAATVWHRIKQRAADQAGALVGSEGRQGGFTGGQAVGRTAGAHWPAPLLPRPAGVSDQERERERERERENNAAKRPEANRQSELARANRLLMLSLRYGAEGLDAGGLHATLQRAAAGEPHTLAVMRAAVCDPLARQRIGRLLRPAQWPLLARAVQQPAALAEMAVAMWHMAGTSGDAAQLRPVIAAALLRGMADAGADRDADGETGGDAGGGETGMAAPAAVGAAGIRLIRRVAVRFAALRNLPLGDGLHRMRGVFPRADIRDLIDRQARFQHAIARLQSGVATGRDPAPPKGQEAGSDTFATCDLVEFHSDIGGIALIWPFVARYFAALELVNDGGFATLAAQERGAHLLHHLASGSALPLRVDLALANLLCGLPPSHPTRPTAPLREAEASLSAGLLSAVCQAWPGLENTTARGLRDSFLMRSARLVTGGDGPDRLTLETRPFDMLLDRVPWPLGLVTFGWMARPLSVDWGRG